MKIKTKTHNPKLEKKKRDIQRKNDRRRVKRTKGK